MYRFLFLLSLISCCHTIIYCQQVDTVKIDASHLKMNKIRKGESQYLVYFKKGKDSSRTRYQLWSRKVDFISYEGQDAVSITQIWENNDTIIHTATTVCKKKDFATLYHDSWWKHRGRSTYDFLKRTAMVQGKLLDATVKDSISIKNYEGFMEAGNQFFLNWHLDLEVFSTLPYRSNTLFLINYYEPGFSAPKNVPYVVIGSKSLTDFHHRKVECWLLEHNEPDNHEIFWISKKTQEVLKLEQEFAGSYRYKIKLGFN